MTAIVKQLFLKNKNITMMYKGFTLLKNIIINYIFSKEKAVCDAK